MRLEDLFWNSLQIGLTASLVGVVLLALRSALRRRYPARAMCFVWLALAVRLLVPVQLTLPEPPVSVAPRTYQVVSAPQAVPEADGAPPRTEWKTRAEAGREPVATRHVVRWGVLLGGLWLAGAGLCVAWGGAAYLLFCRRVRRGARPVAREELNTLLRQERARLGVRREIALAVSPEADCPMLFGLLRPMLLLPEDGLPDADAALVFRHELTHWKHGDLVIKLLLALARCLHWYNPCVRLLARAASEDLELACDSAVARGMSAGERRRYGEVILAHAGRPGTRREAALVSRFGGGKSLKTRLHSLFDSGAKKRGGALLLIVVLTVALVGGSFAIRQDAGAQDSLASHWATEADAFTDLAARWGQGMADRNGKALYELYAAKPAAAFLTEREAMLAEIDPDGTLAGTERERALWRIGVSSPWVNAYTVAAVDEEARTATLVYNWFASPDYRTAERLHFGKEHGAWKVTQAEPLTADDGAVTTLQEFRLLYGNELGLPEYLFQYGSQLSPNPTEDYPDNEALAEGTLRLTGGRFESSRFVPFESSESEKEILTYRFADGSAVTVEMFGGTADWYDETGANTRTLTDLARQWAVAMENKSVAQRLPIMTDSYRKAFIKDRQEMANDGGKWYFRIGGSSPTAKRFTVSSDEQAKTADIVYALYNSEPREYRHVERLTFEPVDGRYRVARSTDTSFFGDAEIYRSDSLEHFLALYDNELGLPQFDGEEVEAIREKGLAAEPVEAAEFMLLLEGGSAEIVSENVLRTEVRYRYPNGDTLRIYLQNDQRGEAGDVWFVTAWETGDGARSYGLPQGTRFESATYGIALDLPADWEGKYSVSDPGNGGEIVFYQKEPGNAEGALAYLCAEPRVLLEREPGWTDAQIEDAYPVPMRILGERNGVTYYLRFPSDVEWDIGNQAVAEEYAQMDRGIRALGPEALSFTQDAGAERQIYPRALASIRGELKDYRTSVLLEFLPYVDWRFDEELRAMLYDRWLNDPEAFEEALALQSDAARANWEDIKSWEME